MTKKDYIALASIFCRRCAVCGRQLRKLSGNVAGCAVHGVQQGEAPAYPEMLDELMSLLKQDNPRFDRERFEDAVAGRFNWKD